MGFQINTALFFIKKQHVSQCNSVTLVVLVFLGFFYRFFFFFFFFFLEHMVGGLGGFVFFLGMYFKKKK